jgi:hypothetical protein
VCCDIEQTVDLADASDASDVSDDVDADVPEDEFGGGEDVNPRLRGFFY